MKLSQSSQRIPSLRMLVLVLVSIFLGVVSGAPGEGVQRQRLLRSTSLTACAGEEGFTASLFNVTYSPDDDKATADINAVSTIEGYVKFDITLYAYGYNAINHIVDPCDDGGLPGFCPMIGGRLIQPFNIPVSAEAKSKIPAYAYSIPDMDAKIRILVNRTTGEHESIACLEAQISNGQTVDLFGVKLATGLVTATAIASSAVLSALGHANAASHVAAMTLSLFAYLQSQAIVGLVGVPLPPLAQAWAQNLMWSLGIIKVDFLQDVFGWYQRALGGTPSNLFDSLATLSVHVQKRSGNIQQADKSFIVTGIQRVAFLSQIETSNLFLTTVFSFLFCLIVTGLCVLLLKGLLEVAAQSKAMWLVADSINDFRSGWRVVLKGVLYRVTMIAYPALLILSGWELVQRETWAHAVIAGVYLVGPSLALGWAAGKIVMLSRRSIRMHRNAAYILFSDLCTLNRWGFLYVQFRATAYYYIVPMLGYTVVKSLVVGCAQENGNVQVIALLVLDLAAFVAGWVQRPWMDKKTNSFNMPILLVNVVNGVCVLIFSTIFPKPGLLIGVTGVVFWLVNTTLTLVLLLMLLWSTYRVLRDKNPDARYQVMADDRQSFMKSRSRLEVGQQLEDLSATARSRGILAGPEPGLMIDLEDGAATATATAATAATAVATTPTTPTATETATAMVPGVLNGDREIDIDAQSTTSTVLRHHLVESIRSRAASTRSRAISFADEQTPSPPPPPPPPPHAAPLYEYRAPSRASSRVPSGPRSRSRSGSTTADPLLVPYSTPTDAPTLPPFPWALVPPSHLDLSVSPEGGINVGRTRNNASPWHRGAGYDDTR